MKFPPPFIPGSKDVFVVIETPKNSGSKYVYDETTMLFKLKKILPLGMVFPFHFGFIPNTKGDDGDPVDALVLLDEPAYPGCLVECRVLGAIEALQSAKGNSIRNDRIITAAVESTTYANVGSLKDLDKHVLEELSKFFRNYNEIEGKTFEVLGKANKTRAINLIKKSTTHG